MNHLVYLRTFLDAYRAGSLTKAAQRLGITQPAASAHIATLEAVLGKPLFKREARGVAPTPAADDLARSIAAQLDGLEATMSIARARSPHLAGTVDLIGPAEYLAARVAPLLVPLMVEGLRFRIQTGNRQAIYSALDDGRADLAVTASPPNGKVHGFAGLGRERLVLVTSPDLAERIKGRVVSADLLREIPCIAYDETLPLVRPFFASVFEAEADSLAVATAPDLRIVLSLVGAGAGWTVVPDYLCVDQLEARSLVELPTLRTGPENALYLAWNKGALRHPRVVHVRDFLLSQHDRS